MKLSKVERLILANQYQLLSKEENGYLSKKTCLNYATILLEGYELLYDDVFIGMNEEVSSEQCRFVLDVLNMYRTISNSFSDLSDTTLVEKDIAFRGFDGNEETKEYSFLKFIINEYDRFEDLKENQYMKVNSHGRKILNYKEQLNRYNQIIKIYEKEFYLEGYRLTEGEIKEILGIK